MSAIWFNESAVRMKRLILNWQIRSYAFDSFAEKSYLQKNANRSNKM